MDGRPDATSPVKLKGVEPKMHGKVSIEVSNPGSLTIYVKNVRKQDSAKYSDGVPRNGHISQHNGVLVAHAPPLDRHESHERQNAQQRVRPLDLVNVLEQVDPRRNELVGLATLDAQQSAQLSAGDGHCRGIHESAHGGHGQELHEESQVEEAEQEDDAPADEGREHSQVCVEFGDNREGHDGEDGGGTDGEVLGAAEEEVHEAAHEAGIEAVLCRQSCQCGVRNALRDDRQRDSQACDNVGHDVGSFVLWQPDDDRQVTSEALHAEQ
jgi:hypothetical protein